MPAVTLPKRVAKAQAARDAGQVVDPELRELPLSLIDEPTLPARESMDSDSMQELMDSIRELGLLSPISVTTKGARFEVAAGHRRLLAYKYLHKDFIRAFVYPEGYEGGDAVMLHENIVREQLNPAQEAVFLAQLIERYGMTEADLAKKLKRVEGYVCDRLALLRGDPMIFEYLRDGRINFGVARILNRFPNEEIRRYYLEHAARSGATARVVDDWLKAWKEQVQPALEAAKAAQAAVAQLPPSENPMTCRFCGGGRDAYNLRQIWVHYWELDQIDGILRQLSEANAQAQAEMALKQGGNADG